MRAIQIVFFVLSLLFVFKNCIADDERQSKQAITVPDIFISSDSEHFSTYKYRMGYLPLYEHGEKYTGISYQHNYFTQDSWHSSAEQLSLSTKAINPRTGLGYNLNVGYNVENGYKLLTTDSSYGFQLTDSTKTEFLISRDRVETQNSLNNGIHYTLAGISAEQQITERLSATLMGGYMHFSRVKD